MRIGVYIEPIIQQSAGIHQYTKQLVHALEAYGSFRYVLIGSERIQSSLPQEVIPAAGLPIYHPARWTRNHPVLASLDLLIDPSHFGSLGVFPREKRVVALHDMSALLYPQWHKLRTVMAHRLFVRSWLKKSKGVFTVSESSRSDIKSRDASVSPRIISPGIAYHYQESKQPKHPLPDQYFLSVGAAEPRKNLARLLQAMTAIDAEAHLVIAGPEGWKFDLAQSIKKLGLEHRVHRIGFVTEAELRYLYQHAVSLVYPSLYEGFGLPLLEAMANGCPVVTSSHGAMKEVVGGAAILVDPLQVDSIRAGMNEVLFNSALRETLISAGEHRSKSFSWATSIKRLEAFLTQLNG